MSTNKTIAKHRKQAGLTQEQLAEKINISRQTLATWETGRQIPSDHVAILAARALGISEEEMLVQLHRDRLYQRVDRLQQQYNMTITVETEKEKQNMKALSGKLTQMIDGVALTMTRIYKSTYWDKAHEVSSLKVFEQGFNFQMEHTGCKLFLHLLCENRNDQLDLLGSQYYIEDNRGNQFGAYSCGVVDSDADDVWRFFEMMRFDYPPEATEFTFHRSFVNRREDDCEAVLFENVPLDGKATKTKNGDVIKYDGFRRAPGDHHPAIHLVHDKPREVRHIGVTKVQDNLGNQYTPCGRGHGSQYDNDVGGYPETFALKDLAPNATSIHFKYLVARTILSFEFSDLPLP